MKLNGWQRLWVVISACWIGYWLYLVAKALVDYGWGWSAPDVGLFLAWMVAPPLLLYGVGWIVRWVIKGFRAPA